MTSASPCPVCEGEILDGKYRVDRVLGVGGMGVVVAASHVQLQTRVALKFLLPEVLSSPETGQRFLREARAAVRIQSEHVARVIDVGTLGTGAPYMVMEYLEGQDLCDLLAAHRPLAVDQAVGYLLEACEAIAEAHALGIVHRDLKPANLFLTKRTGRAAMIKVLDFGISKTQDAVSGGLTKTSAVMGSPCYMSPEQMRSSKVVDARSDLWSLGVILYELVTGVLPFQGETLPEIVYQVTQGEPRPMRDLCPDIPEGLDRIIGRCLSREPDHRYDNVAELARSLAPFAPAQAAISLDRICRVLRVEAATEATSLAPASAAQARENPSLINAAVTEGGRSGAWSRQRQRWRLLLGLGGALGVMAAGAAWYASRGTEPTAPLRAPRSTATPAPSPLSVIPASPPAPAVPALATPDAGSPMPSQRTRPTTLDAASVSRVVESPQPMKPTARRTASAGRVREQPRAAPAARGLNMELKE